MAPHDKESSDRLDHQVLREAEILYVCFGSHHVTVSSSSAQVNRRFLSFIGRMLAQSAKGTCAGFLEVVAQDGVISIAGPENAYAGKFIDPAPAARALLHAVIKLLIAARSDLLWLHAAVAASGGRAVLLSAPSGQGKSTVIAELLARGWSYLSDEIAPIDPTNQTVLPFPVTPYMRVSGTQALPTTEVQRLRKLRVDLPVGVVSALPVPLGRVYFLSYSPLIHAAQLKNCSPGAAVIEMLRNSFGSSVSREFELSALCKLMSRVPGAHLSYANSRDAAEQLTADRVDTISHC